MGKEVPKEAVFERRHLEFVECPGGGGGTKKNGNTRVSLEHNC